MLRKLELLVRWKRKIEVLLIVNKVSIGGVALEEFREYVLCLCLEGA